MSLISGDGVDVPSELSSRAERPEIAADVVKCLSKLVNNANQLNQSPLSEPSGSCSAAPRF